jgi:iron complex outermembrane receptor protein
MRLAAALAFLLCTGVAHAQTPATSGQTQSEQTEPQPLVTVEEHVTVSATRTDKRLEDQPMRVEVLGRDEIEEKMLMTPGDIVMMLNEMGGMRVQATSPSLGAASVRIQGMRGRYTRVFSDGLPLFGEVGGLGLLQIPPMDLGQVEVIKASPRRCTARRHGGRRQPDLAPPGREAQSELLLNQSTRGATDAVAWYATPARTGWAFTLLGGGHHQAQNDVNDDQWIDLAGYSRGVVRPRVFWDNGNGRTFFATAGVTAEDREGGGMPAGTPYVEALDTRRMDAGAVGQILLRQRYVLSARAAVMQQRHDHQFGEVRERDRHETAFGEVTLRAPAGRHTLVAGAALERDAYRPTDVPQFRYTFTVPGVFIQDDVDLARWVSVSASARLDDHSVYGTFLSPRASALLRAGAWTSRLSAGAGFLRPVAADRRDRGGRLVAPRDPAAASCRRGPQRVAGHRPHRWGALVLLHVLRRSSPPCDQRRSLARSRAHQSDDADDERRRRAARHLPPSTLFCHDDLHLRASTRGRQRRAATGGAYAAALGGGW